MIKSVILGILIAVGGTGIVSATDTDSVAYEGTPDRIWLGEGPKPTVEQTILQCRYESQIARGLTSTMWVLAQAMGEIPPKQFMQNYIAHFYNSHDRAETIAAAGAAKALNWIYLLIPPVDQSRAVEKAYYKDCMDGFPTFNKARDEMINKASTPNKDEGVAYNEEEFF